LGVDKNIFVLLKLSIKFGLKYPKCIPEIMSITSCEDNLAVVMNITSNLKKVKL